MVGIERHAITLGLCVGELLRGSDSPPAPDICVRSNGAAQTFPDQAGRDICMESQALLFQPPLDYPLHQPFNPLLTPQHILAHTIHLDIDRRPLPLPREHQFPLTVPDQHDPKRPGRVVHGREGERGAVDGDVPLFDEVGQEGGGLWELEEVPEGVAIGGDGEGGGGAVDVALGGGCKRGGTGGEEKRKGGRWRRVERGRPRTWTM